MVSQNVTLIADTINAGSYSQPLTAEVSWAPRFDNKDNLLQCFVWCDNARYTRDTRCPASQFEQTVKVAVRKTVSVDIDSEVSDCIVLTEEVIDALRLTPSLSNGVVFDRIEWYTVYDHQALFEDSIFVSVFSIDLRKTI